MKISELELNGFVTLVFHTVFQNSVSNANAVLGLALITFRIKHSQARCIVMTAVCVSVCVCLSLASFIHYCTGPDVTLRNGRGYPIIVEHY